MHKNGTLLLRSGGNNENEDSINSSSGGDEVPTVSGSDVKASSKSLPASPVFGPDTKKQPLNQQDLFLAAARTAVANAAARQAMAAAAQGYLRREKY